MNLFTMVDWKLTLDPQVWGLTPFRVLLERDKTKDKVVANAEMLFIWFYTDIKSDYLFLGEKERAEEIKKNIHALPKDWKIDKEIEDAIAFYKKSSETIIQYLYKKAMRSAQDAADYMGETASLLRQLDNSGKPIYRIRDITGGLKDVKIIMRDLKEAEREVIKETEDNVGKSSGSQKFNLFEGGFNDL